MQQCKTLSGIHFQTTLSGSFTASSITLQYPLRLINHSLVVFIAPEQQLNYFLHLLDQHLGNELWSIGLKE